MEFLHRLAHACRAFNQKFFCYCYPEVWNDPGHELGQGRLMSRGPGSGSIGRADLGDYSIFSALGLPCRLGDGLGKFFSLILLLGATTLLLLGEFLGLYFVDNLLAFGLFDFI